MFLLLLRLNAVNYIGRAESHPTRALRSFLPTAVYSCTVPANGGYTNGIQSLMLF